MLLETAISSGRPRGRTGAPVKPGYPEPVNIENKLRKEKLKSLIQSLVLFLISTFLIFSL